MQQQIEHYKIVSLQWLTGYKNYVKWEGSIARFCFRNEQFIIEKDFHVLDQLVKILKSHLAIKLNCLNIFSIDRQVISIIGTANRLRQLRVKILKFFALHLKTLRQVREMELNRSKSWKNLHNKKLMKAIDIIFELYDHKSTGFLRIEDLKVIIQHSFLSIGQSKQLNQKEFQNFLQKARGQREKNISKLQLYNLIKRN